MRRLVIAVVWAGALAYAAAVARLMGRLSSGGPIAPAERIQSLILLLCWALATPLILRSAERFPIGGPRWLARSAAHLAAATGFILATNLLAPPLAHLLLGLPVAPARLARYGLLQFLALYHIALIVYAFILGIGHYLGMAEARRQDEIRTERQRADLAQAELRALKLQLQPHFLFNTLNAVGSLILTGRNTEAFEAVGQLGDLLRGVMATERRHEVALRAEIELTQAYLAIEQTRLGDRLKSAIEVAPDVLGAQMPPLLLQPLVENAIRHGIGRSAAGGEVVIRAARAGDRLSIDVCDNGPGLDRPGEGTGLGLENARRRLAHLYGPDQRLELVRVGPWTEARLEIPFHVGPLEAARLP